MSDLWPFGDLPAGWEAYFALALFVIVAMFAWSLLLFVRGQRAMRRAPEASPGVADAFSWVFLVPALNEEVTIRDSVERLLDLDLSERRVLVIDDGSDDRTAEILAEIDHPDLTTIHRREPEARKGKAAALNHAYHWLDGIEQGRERVIVAIVDADGRLHPEAPAFAAAHFADPEVGGLQSLVRIYNRQRFLTWLQDVEFSVYGYLFQAGRNGWGTAGMGGNGQFNRLSGARRGRRRARALARPPHRGPGPGAAADRGRLEGTPGAARHRRPAGSLQPQGAVSPAHPLVAGEPAGDGAAREGRCARRRSGSGPGSSFSPTC